MNGLYYNISFTFIIIKRPKGIQPEKPSEHLAKPSATLTVGTSPKIEAAPDQVKDGPGLMPSSVDLQ
jgi:hypothetical protein